MKQVLLSFLLLCSSISIASAKNKRYVFFLHNMYLEQAGLNGEHPEYGRVEYKEVISAFEKEGFTVISEVRKNGTDAVEYAKKVKRQADSLIATGVRASYITVVGTSKGAFIAWHVAGMMGKKNMNFVLIGICNESTIADNKNVQPSGNILSIYEKTDVIGQSCLAVKNSSTGEINHFREIELNTGQKHGFLYKASPLWLGPAIKWAKGNYE